MSNKIKHARKGPKTGVKWAQRTSYVPALIPYLIGVYGTLENLADKHNISRLTARKFMVTPGKLRADLCVKILGSMGVEPCEFSKIIGEGEE